MLFKGLIRSEYWVHNMYLLTEWEGRTGKYLARGHGVRTERSEVRAPWPRAKYFPVRPDLTKSISILSYDHRAFPFFFFFRVTKFGMFTYVAHFDRKVVLVRISRALSLQNYWENPRMRAVRDPSRAGRLFPALLAPSRTALIRGFSQ